MSFYKINNEILIDEIMDENKFNLICILFSADDLNKFSKDVINNTRIIKKGIKKTLSEKYNDVIFIYVDLNNYVISENKYSKYISKNSLPYVGFYFNSNQLASISLANLEVIESGILQLKEKIDKLVFEKKEENNKDNNEDNNEDNNNEESEIENNKDMVNINQEEINKKNLLIQQQQIREELIKRKKIEEIEKLRQQYFINELTRIKRAKELEEQNDN
jgi:hypothetical protein